MDFRDTLAIKLVRGCAHRGSFNPRYHKRTKDLMYELDNICLTNSDDVLMGKVKKWYDGLGDTDRHIVDAVFWAGATR